MSSTKEVGPAAQVAGAVSVIMPVLGSGEDIGPALQSVLAQTLPPLEVIIVSARPAAELLQDISAAQLIVKHVPCPAGASVSLARNIGVAAAGGEFIAFSEPAALWHADKLARQIAYLDAHSEVALVHTGCTVTVNGKETAYLDKPPRLTARDLMTAGHLLVPTMLMRTSVFRDSGGFDVSFYETEGLEFAFRLVDLGHHLDFIAQPLVHMQRIGASGPGFDWHRYFRNHATVVWRQRHHYRRHAGLFGPWQHICRHLRNAGHRQRGKKGLVLRMIARILWPLPSR